MYVEIKRLSLVHKQLFKMWLPNSVITLSFVLVWLLIPKGHKAEDFSTEFGRNVVRRSKTAEILSMMDLNEDPCRDFYKFSCGNWHRSFPAQFFGDIMTDRFRLLSKNMERRLHRLLNIRDDKPNNGTDTVESKMRKFFKSCKSIPNNLDKYKQAVASIIEPFGKFSFQMGEAEWQSYEFNWWSTVAKIEGTYGFSIIMSTEVLADVKNNSNNMVYIGTEDIAMASGSGILQKAEVFQIRENLVKYFGATKEVAKTVATEIVKFESLLFHDSKSLETINVLYNVTDLQLTYSDHMDIVQFLQLRFNTTKLPETVYVEEESFMENLVALIKTNDSKTINDYILWKLVSNFLLESAPSEKVCTEKLTNFFAKFVDHIMYQSYKSDKFESEIFDLWSEIKETFETDLQGDKYYWMSNETRINAIKKLRKMNLTITSYDEENFDEYYAGLTIDSDNYVQNVDSIFRLQESNMDNKLDSIAESIEQNAEMSFTPTYMLQENVINLPVGILQPHFFWDVNYPKALKYATLGYLIAHEMIHGFDDEGRHFDAKGNSRIWWDPKSVYEFMSRRKCFQAQYSQYRYGGKKLPYSVSQGENIADNAAVKLSYSAYLRWLSKQQLSGQDDVEAMETLPNLEWNNRKLFFITFAQVWCEDVHTFFKTDIANGDEHAPGMYRVIGPLSNFPEFSWIFGCKHNDPMDPEYKCNIY